MGKPPPETAEAGPTSPMRSTSRRVAKTRQAKASYRLKGSIDNIIPGDCVLVRSEGPMAYVAKVKSIESTKSSTNVKVLWYYRPEEVIGGRRAFHGAKEVFLSNHEDTQSACTIEKKCNVYSLEEYTKLNSIEADDFYCRLRYNSKTGKFSPQFISVYCSCAMPYNPDHCMIQCDSCTNWFHPLCIDGPDVKTDSQELFFCPNCSKKKEDAVYGGDHAINSKARTKGRIWNVKKRIDDIKDNWVHSHEVPALNSCTKSRHDDPEEPEKISTNQQSHEDPSEKAEIGVVESLGDETEAFTQYSNLQNQEDPLVKAEVHRQEEKEVCIIYDERMLMHIPPCGTFHWERPDRISAIHESLKRMGLLESCAVYYSEKADLRHVKYVHGEAYVQRILSHKPTKVKVKRNGNDEGKEEADDMYFSTGTADAVLLAAGGAVKACRKVYAGEHRSAFAIVRPPGHHAKRNRESGFCFFNNVAIAARFLIREHNVARVLIVDIDVHHGNGTQQIFYEDPQVLVVSLHRHPFFPYPYDNSGTEECIGKSHGRGFNCNICWKEKGISNDDLYAAWDYVVMPLALEFDPDFILVSGGYDAAMGDDIGGCCVTSKGYASVLNQLAQLNKGLVIVLEGGYNTDILGECVSSCVKVLNGDASDLHDSSEYYYPFESTWKSILLVKKKLGRIWRSLRSDIPADVLARIRSST